jgi:membrane protein YdbS with pleckstrin-like domain
VPDRQIGIGLRLLLGFLGVVAVGAGGAVGANAIRTASKSWPNWPSIAAAAFCVIVVCGGLLLLRGAVNGHIMVRRARWRWPTT